MAKANNDYIKELYAPLQSLVKILISNLVFDGYFGFITQGKRTTKEQNELYNIGRRGIKGEKIITYARAGYSFHEYGLAIDMAFRNESGKVSWDKSLFEKAWELGKKLGFNWGGDWFMRDMPHLQYQNGLYIGEIRAGEFPVVDYSKLNYFMTSKEILRLDKKVFIQKNLGRIFLAVEAKGEAYY